MKMPNKFMEKNQNIKTAPFASYYVLQEERYFVILHHI